MRNIQIQRGISIGVEICSTEKKTSYLDSFWGGRDAMETKYNMPGLGDGRGGGGGALASASAFGVEGVTPNYL